VKRSGERDSWTCRPYFDDASGFESGRAELHDGKPGGGKLYNAKGANGYVYNRLRNFEGVYVAASSHVYYPANDPTPGRANKKLFSVRNCTAPRRKAASIAADPSAVEKARAEGRSVAYQASLEQRVESKAALSSSRQVSPCAWPTPISRTCGKWDPLSRRTTRCTWCF